MQPTAASIHIPTRLDALLGDSELAQAVRLSVRSLEHWIADPNKGLFFFPEYTDHGPAHISSTLASAEALIREEAWSHLTSEDAAVLVLSTLLHDSAMHLTADGFLDLTDPDYAKQHPLIQPLDEKNWTVLFDDFFAEARRWDQRKLHRILGDQNKHSDEEEDLYTYILRPKEALEPDTWSIRYRKFLGEFVRRHHARLAHEIASYGVPGPSLNRLALVQVPKDYADLSGLVARSHNIQLRDTFAYLKKRFSGRVVCRKSHPIFLMVLLRIADYLQLESGRANPAIMRVQRLRSPISQEEWDTHHAAHEVRPDEEDRESIFVDARPKTAREFIKLRHLFNGMQHELDTSWAVLGEVYSRQDDLSSLGITLRRIRSNLDHVERFVKDQDPSYFPIHAAFDTAGADLLKLLINPLYSARPEIGIRELLQNSLDAVFEIRQWAADHGDPELKAIPLSNQEADVLISIDRDEEGHDWLTVNDKGIGMTADIVQNYFLKAGASYRKSDTWRRSFEVDGQSTVLRSGRFGIGVLAAFLLGSRIQVSTRHVNSSSREGVRMEVSVDDQGVELHRLQREVVGTEIRVRLTQAAATTLVKTNLSGLPWDWYVLDNPKVERWVHGRKLLQHYNLPGIYTIQGTNDWRQVYPEGYQTVGWSYSDAPGLVCNGIKVRERFTEYAGSLFDSLSPPSISVFDPNGRLPLNLTRDRLEVNHISFSADLFKDVAADFCAFLLVHAPTKPQFKFGTYPAGVPIKFGLSSTGTLCDTDWHIRRSGIRRYVLLLATEVPLDEVEEFALRTPADAAVFCEECWNPAEITQLVGRLRIRQMGHRILLKSSHSDYPSPNNWNDLDLEIYTAGKTDPEDGWTKELARFINKHEDIIGLAEIYLTPQKKSRETHLEGALAEFMDSAIIPYNLEERHRMFSRSFEKLRPHIEAWQALNLAGWRKILVDELGHKSFQPIHNGRGRW